MLSGMGMASPLDIADDEYGLKLTFDDLSQLNPMTPSGFKAFETNLIAALSHCKGMPTSLKTLRCEVTTEINEVQLVIKRAGLLVRKSTVRWV